MRHSCSTEPKSQPARQLVMHGIWLRFVFGLVRENAHKISSYSSGIIKLKSTLCVVTSCASDYRYSVWIWYISYAPCVAIKKTKRRHRRRRSRRRRCMYSIARPTKFSTFPQHKLWTRANPNPFHKCGIMGSRERERISTYKKIVSAHFMGFVCVCVFCWRNTCSVNTYAAENVCRMNDVFFLDDAHQVFGALFGPASHDDVNWEVWKAYGLDCISIEDIVIRWDTITLIIRFLWKLGRTVFLYSRRFCL